MTLFDVLEKIYNKEKGYFKFFVKGYDNWTKENSINWEYEDGYVKSDDGDNLLFIHIARGTYKLDSKIEIIKDYIEIDGTPLLYIENNTPGRLKYGSSEVTSDYDTDLLAGVINKIILEIEEIKKGK